MPVFRRIPLAGGCGPFPPPPYPVLCFLFPISFPCSFLSCATSGRPDLATSQGATPLPSGTIPEVFFFWPPQESPAGGGSAPLMGPKGSKWSSFSKCVGFLLLLQRIDTKLGGFKHIDLTVLKSLKSVSLGCHQGRVAL